MRQLKLIPLLILAVLFQADYANSTDYKSPLFASEEEALSFEHFCFRFDAIEWQVVYRTIKEIEATPYSVDKFLTTPACQSQEQPPSVKSPLLHFIVEDTVKREKFLFVLWEYYTKKRHDPAKFAAAVNAKSTRGETLLDYFATYFSVEHLQTGELAAAAKRIVAFACERGAEYSIHSDMRCP